jgi:hypothetical protein
MEIINRIWNYRKKPKFKYVLRFDVGANVHVLYPENDRVAVLQFKGRISYLRQNVSVYLTLKNLERKLPTPNFKFKNMKGPLFV